MKKEERLILLAVLTMLAYAFSIFLTAGVFIIPFPLIPFVLLVVSFRFTLWHIKRYKFLILPLSVAFLGVLASPMLWETILSYRSQQAFYETALIDILHLLYVVGFVIWSIAISFKQRHLLSSTLSFLGAAGIIFSMIYSDQYALAGAFALTSISLIFKPTRQPSDLLWHLCAILIGLQAVSSFLA